MHLIEIHMFEKMSLQALMDSVDVNDKIAELTEQKYLFSDEMKFSGH